MTEDDSTSHHEPTPMNEEVTTAGTFYEQLVSQLVSENDATKIPSRITQAAKDVSKRTNEPFSTAKLSDEVARRLLKISSSFDDDDDDAMDMDTSTEDSQGVLILALVHTLAQLDASLYLPALAASVHKLVVVQHQSVTNVSSSLLQLWIQQLTHSDSVAVHAHLLEALVVLSQHTPAMVAQSMALLVPIWENSLHNASNKANSIVGVRCATLWIQWMAKLGGDGGGNEVLDANAAPPNLFCQMLQNFDDPLQQVTMMDLLVEQFGSSSTLTDTVVVDANVQEWLASPALISPILQMLQDPLLSGVALQYLSGVLVSLRPHELRLVLDHIRECGIVSNETDRLQIVQALSSVTTMASPLAALPLILQDATLRHAWWDMVRISQSKLQAAILTSIALALPQIDAAAGVEPSLLAMKLYNFVGPDNDTTSGSTSVCTTQWLLDKFVASPMTELRIGAYALLAAMLRLQTAGQILALHTPQATQTQLLEVWMDPQERRREGTSDARLAYFDVLESLYALLTASSTATNGVWLATMQEDLVHKVTEQLQKKLLRGPHGREPQRWDVATE